MILLQIGQNFKQFYKFCWNYYARMFKLYIKDNPFCFVCFYIDRHIYCKTYNESKCTFVFNLYWTNLHFNIEITCVGTSRTPVIRWQFWVLFRHIGYSNWFYCIIHGRNLGPDSRVELVILIRWYYWYYVYVVFIWKKCSLW